MIGPSTCRLAGTSIGASVFAGCVVEAQAVDGQLFGFDRTLALSRESAEKVARAAQAFGQEDDITVLTLQWPGIGAAHA